MLKPEIHDPQGDAIAESAHRLGYSGVVSVRQGKRFEVEISGPVGGPELEAMAKLASDLLANPVIEEFTLHAGDRCSTSRQCCASRSGQVPGKCRASTGQAPGK